MSLWILYGAQAIHAGLFATVSVKAEWRRPGLILAGFALLYLYFGVASVNTDIMAYNEALHKTLFSFIDLVAATMIFTLCKPSNHNKSFKRFHWLGLTAVLGLFWVTHYLNFRYASNLPVSVDAETYEVLVLMWMVLEGSFAGPAIVRQIYESVVLVNRKLARYGRGWAPHNPTVSASLYGQSEYSNQHWDSRRRRGLDPVSMVVHKGSHSEPGGRG